MSTPPGRRQLAGAMLALTLLAGACGSDAAAVTEAPTTTAAETTTTLAETTTTTTAAPQVFLPPVTAPEPIPPDPPEGMELVWSDEFDGDSINLDNWTYDIGGWGWGNGEVQYYTDRPDNARLENGVLVIELRDEIYEGNGWTSARLLTQGLQEFQYGRIEARLKVPAGNGTWPAFWMLGSGFEEGAADPEFQWPNVGEIDIMEYAGKEPDLILGTVHGPGYSAAGGRSRWLRKDFDIADDWHIFAIEWSEDKIQWFFDDEMYYELTPENIRVGEWVFNKPFFMILNLAHGGTIGGIIDPELEYPIQYLADYVRVYQRVPDA